MDKVILPQAELYFMDGCILRINMLHHEEMELDQMKEVYETYTRLAKGKTYCLLADIRKSTGSSTNQARQFAADHAFQPNKIADAIITGSLAKKLMANFYLRFHKPKSLTRLFTNEESALKWLKKICKEKCLAKRGLSTSD